MEDVRAVLHRKGDHLYTISPEETVREAVAQMAEFGVGALPVINEHRLVGILSERDCARKVILEGRSPNFTVVSDIMTRSVITITPGHTVYECLSIVTNFRIRHLPVLNGDLLLGIVSIGDLVNSILSTQTHTIDELRTYISSEYPK
jgi:CBS domain-containing protein